jgi:hypothetical protein
MTFDATAIRRSSGAGFVADGFTTGMDIWFETTGPNHRKLARVHAVAATVLSVYQTLTTSTTINAVIYGNAMSNIGSVRNFQGPGGAPSIIDVTNLQSTMKEKMPGHIDEGQLTFSLFWDPGDAIQGELTTDRKNRTKRFFDVCFTDQLSSDSSAVPSEVGFEGYVTGLSYDGAVDQAIGGNVTIEITGPTMWATRAT